MTCKANRIELESLKNALKEHPGRRPGFFARLLGWRREEVTRSLARLDKHGTLLYEDDEGCLWPFDPKTVSENS